MKVDLTKNGLESVFQPWEIKILDIVGEGGEHTSGSLLNRLNAAGTHISQASIINFLKELRAFEILKVHKEPGKGGMRGVYEFNYTVQSLKDYLAIMAENWAREMRNPSSTKTVKTEE